MNVCVWVCVREREREQEDLGEALEGAPLARRRRGTHHQRVDLFHLSDWKFRQLKVFSTESQGRNLALTVFHVPHSHV